MLDPAAWQWTWLTEDGAVRPFEEEGSDLSPLVPDTVEELFGDPDA